MNTFDKIAAVIAATGFCSLIYLFFGTAGFAVIGIVVAMVAVIALLAWVNHLTGGMLGWMLFLSMLGGD